MPTLCPQCQLSLLTRMVFRRKPSGCLGPGPFCARVVGLMGGHANARVRGFLHSTTRYMYLEHGCTRFCAGGGRWPGRRNEKGPKYVPNKETRYKMRAHAQRWCRTVVPAAPGQAWGTTWPGPTDTNPPGTIWGRPGAVTGHYEYNNNDNILKPHASGSGPIASATLVGPGGHQRGLRLRHWRRRPS